MPLGASIINSPVSFHLFAPIPLLSNPLSCPDCFAQTDGSLQNRLHHRLQLFQLAVVTCKTPRRKENEEALLGIVAKSCWNYAMDPSFGWNLPKHPNIWTTVFANIHKICIYIVYTCIYDIFMWDVCIINDCTCISFSKVTQQNKITVKRHNILYIVVMAGLIMLIRIIQYNTHFRTLMSQQFLSFLKQTNIHTTNEQSQTAKPNPMSSCHPKM